MGRKHCGKRRNCLLRAISPFPTVFSKGLFPSGVKRCYCVGMGLDEIKEQSCVTSNWCSFSPLNLPKGGRNKYGFEMGYSSQ